MATGSYDALPNSHTNVGVLRCDDGWPTLPVNLEALRHTTARSPLEMMQQATSPRIPLTVARFTM